MRVIQAFGAFVCIAFVGTLFVLAYALRTAIFIYTDTEKPVNRRDFREVAHAFVVCAIILALLFSAHRACAETIPYGHVVGVANTWTGSSGGGVVVGANRVLTVAHVVQGADEVAVFFYDDKTPRKAHVHKVEYSTDLALLIVSVPEHIPSIRYGNTPEVGEVAYFLGHPLGHQWLFLRGYVAHGEVMLTQRDRPPIHTVAVDIHVDAGSSGGGVFDEKWRFTGIVSSRHSKLDLAYVIPVETIRKFLRD